MLRKKEFIKFYNHEQEFSEIRGITIDPVYRKDLQAMYAIYKDSKDDKQFTEKMTQAGYGKLN